MGPAGIRAALVTAVAVVVFLPMGLTPMALAADGPPGAPAVPKQRSSKVRAMNATGAREAREKVAASKARNDSSAERADRERTAGRWPEAGEADVPVGGRATVGGLPVALAADGTGPGTGAARVRVLDRAATEAAGVDGVLLTASAPTEGSAELSIGYAAFASAYGGGWGGRLRLVRLPACALTTPEQDGCRTQTPLDSDNAATAQTLSAPVTLGAPRPCWPWPPRPPARRARRPTAAATTRPHRWPHRPPGRRAAVPAPSPGRIRWPRRSPRRDPRPRSTCPTTRAAWTGAPPPATTRAPRPVRASSWRPPPTSTASTAPVTRTATTSSATSAGSTTTPHSSSTASPANSSRTTAPASGA